MTDINQPHYLMWFRRDLRIHDNRALASICQQANDNNAKLSAVFFITPKQWLEHDQSLVLVDHILRTLPILSQDLIKQLNIRLHVLVADDFNQSISGLQEFCQMQGISKVVSNYEYELNESVRDNQAYTQLKSVNIELYQYQDQCIVEPLSVVTKDNNMYQVFTPFYRNWQKKLDISSVILQHAEKVVANGNTESNAESGTTNNVFTTDELMAICTKILADYRSAWQSNLNEGISGSDFDNAKIDELLATSRQRFEAGESNACHKLDQFIADDIEHYDIARDVPIMQATSDLSPYLSIGTISPRLCYVQASKALDNSVNIGLNKANNGLSFDIETITDDNQQNNATDINRWISELAWRDFYRHVLVTRPELIKHSAYHVAKDVKINWSYDKDEFAKWCNGMTGFPFVDSAMRCLNATGFMHNRLRMVTAMFLTKDLLIDWRLGERYFMQTLIDGDFASNNGGWQWSASTGTDAAPYFRIMNPFSQGKTHDTDAEFIKKWLPELKLVPAKILHDEVKLRAFLAVNKSIDYPMPMVEHKKARLATIEAFKA